ncbi:MAG: hypothetical protein CSA44_00155 [Gammaproteobacteria bacterium]|nr:MAG: hypothetical protein CSA44_00155 [Gammaproteobacteria bacterium]
MVIETNNSSFVLADGENLLDALLNSGHEVAYQCRAGYCGSCRTKVHHGAVDYDEVPLAHLNTDEILPCCCRVSESLKLAVDLQRLDSEHQGLLFE